MCHTFSEHDVQVSFVVCFLLKGCVEVWYLAFELIFAILISHCLNALMAKMSLNSMGISQLLQVLHVHKGFQAQAFFLEL